MANAGRKPGTPKTGGRKKGTPNKNKMAVQEKLDALGCDPIEGMAKIAQQAMSEGDLPLAGNMFKELAQYVTPKLKSIEHTGKDGEAIKIENKVLQVKFIEPKVFED